MCFCFPHVYFPWFRSCFHIFLFLYFHMFLHGSFHVLFVHVFHAFSLTFIDGSLFVHGLRSLFCFLTFAFYDVFFVLCVFVVCVFHGVVHVLCFTFSCSCCFFPFAHVFCSWFFFCVCMCVFVLLFHVLFIFPRFHCCSRCPFTCLFPCFHDSPCRCLCLFVCFVFLWLVHALFIVFRGFPYR